MRKEETPYQDEIYRWGREAQKCSQGYAVRLLDRRFFHTAWYELFYTLERDGKMRYEGNMWRSENDILLSYRAVVDDYGMLIPVT